QGASPGRRISRMEHPGFFHRAGPFPLAEVAAATKAELPPGADPNLEVFDVRALSDAAAGDLSFLDNRKYLGQLTATRAGVCLVAPALAASVPKTTTALVTREPCRGFALALNLFYPDAMRPKAGAAGGTALI